MSAVLLGLGRHLFSCKGEGYRLLYLWGADLFPLHFIIVSRAYEIKVLMDQPVYDMVKACTST